MLNFEFHLPTHFVFGKGAELETGKRVKELGGNHVLVHYGMGSVVRSGLLDRVVASLKEEGIQVELLGGAVPNPLDTLVYEGIELVRWANLDREEQKHCKKLFKDRIFPVLTPLAVDPGHPFPYISGLSLNLAVVVANPTTGKEHFARVKVPPLLPRYIAVDARGRPSAPSTTTVTSDAVPTSFVPLEDVIATHLDYLFPGMQIREVHTFRVTRNEDIDVEEDDAENLLQAMEKELLRRRFGPPVRLELAQNTAPRIRELLIRELGIAPSEVYELPAPLDLTGLNLIADLDRSDLHYEPFVPTTHRHLAEVESATPTDVFAQIRARDILLHHPYDSFSTSVQTFLAQAAADPQVLAIKQTLYRTAGDSPIVDSLIDAA